MRFEAAKYRNPLLIGEDAKKAIQKEKEKEAEKGGRSTSFGVAAQKPQGTIHLLVSLGKEDTSSSGQRALGVSWVQENLLNPLTLISLGTGMPPFSCAEKERLRSHS